MSGLLVVSGYACPLPVSRHPRVDLPFNSCTFWHSRKLFFCMNDFGPIDRRRFLQAGLLSSSALAASAWPRAALAGAVKPTRDPWGGLKFGITSYTFRAFTLDQVIAMTKEAG
jgi:hypothetical protein